MSLDPKVRAEKWARWASVPVCLAGGGVLVASANAQSDETGFAVGLAAAALGSLTHAVFTKWRPGKGH